MIVHMCIGTNDLERGAKFYDALAAVLGIARSMETATAIGWTNPAGGVGIAITKPYDGNPASVGNGTMASIGAADSGQVDRLHAAALANGGSCEGLPGLRANGLYAAYFRDPDGNKLNTFAFP
jgi:catechol 2,3-dioxygenase-like lactoylglutathione lyase family enzyme